MPADIAHEDNPALARIARRTTPAAALAALGIVYGDLGTSPLYTLQAVVGATGGHFSPEIFLPRISWKLGGKSRFRRQIGLSALRHAKLQVSIPVHIEL